MPRKRMSKKLPTEAEVLHALQHESERRQKEVLAHYLTAARMIPLRIDIWHNLERIFYAGIADAEEDEKNGYTTCEKELYAIILDMIPMFGPVIEACAAASDSEDATSQAFETFLKLVSESALNSRTSDMHTVKEKVLLYAPATTEFTRLKLDLAVTTDQKVKRGWNDPQCTSLLLPPRYQDEFFHSPLTFMAKIRSSQIKIKASEFPAFLYADGSKIDPKKPHRGLLKGSLLVRVFRCIFTGPSTAMRKDARNTSKSQAEIHKISTVEPFGIVYAAVLIRQALSSTQWGAKDLHFDYRIFTDQLLGLFKDPKNPWVQRLLVWWNNQVCFTKASGLRGASEDIDDSSDNENAISVDDLLAHAANDQDSDTHITEEEIGSPLSAGTALAPSNTSHRNVLLSVAHDAAQASRERSLSVRQSLPPPSPAPASSATSSQTLTTATSISTLSSPVPTNPENALPGPEEPNRQQHDNSQSPHQSPVPVTDPVPGPLTERNMNGKRTNPQSSSSAFPKKARGGVSRGGSSRGGSSSHRAG